MGTVIHDEVRIECPVGIVNTEIPDSFSTLLLLVETEVEVQAVGRRKLVIVPAFHVVVIVRSVSVRSNDEGFSCRDRHPAA